MDLTLHPLHRGDIPAWNRLLAEIEQVEGTGEHYNEDDLAEEMANPDIELGKDIVGAYDGEQLVGYFTVYARPNADECHKVQLEGAVHPGRRGEGIGTRLAEAMLARAEEAHAERHPGVPALYSLTGLADNHAQVDLMARLGLRPERWNFVMRADLSQLPDPLPFPPGFRLERYDETWDAAMHEAHNAAFTDHPNFTPWTDAMWKQWVSQSRNFRPDLSYLLAEEAAPERVACYVQTNEYDAYYQATGRREAYVAKVGTRREHRGRGLAGALLRHCLRAYQAAGFDEASLDVDSENPTGALGIYQRAGFEVESRRADYVRRQG